MNECKELSTKVGVLYDKIAMNDVTDKRWLAIRITDLQKGFMSTIRSIAKPTTF